MQGRGFVALIVMGAFVFAGCDSSARTTIEVSRDHGIPILASELSNARTPLGDGFSVPRDAVLAGAVLPADPALLLIRRTLAVRGWTAVLGVGGSPAHVATAFLAQAETAGLPGLPPQPYCDAYSCSFSSALNASPDFRTVSGRFVEVTVISQAHDGTSALVSFEDRGGPDAVDSPPNAGLPSAAYPPRPAKPSTLKLPTAGEPIGFEYPVQRSSRAMTVIDGTAMVTPVRRTNSQERAILRVTGNPNDAYRRYVRQAHTVFPRSHAARPRSDTFVAGWRLSSTNRSTEFSSLTVELLTRHDQSYIRLTTSQE